MHWPCVGHPVSMRSLIVPVGLAVHRCDELGDDVKLFAGALYGLRQRWRVVFPGVNEGVVFKSKDAFGGRLETVHHDWSGEVVGGWGGWRVDMGGVLAFILC